VFVYAGNLLGTFVFGFLIRFCLNENALLKATALAQYKLALPLLNVLILSFFCGIMMYAAVTGFKKIGDPVGKHLAIVLPVMVFIISGFEHSIADLFYISAANAWGVDAVKFSLVAAAGNLLGGCAVPAVLKFSTL
jgi:formate/nitrite transporter FocA (FNT family)